MLRLSRRIYFLSALLLLQVFGLCNYRIRNGKVRSSGGLRCWTWFLISISIVATSLNFLFEFYGIYQIVDPMIMLWDIFCSIFCGFFVLNFYRHQKILKHLILNFLNLNLHTKFTEGKQVFIHTSMFILLLLVFIADLFNLFLNDINAINFETIVKIFILEFVFPFNHIAFTFFYVCVDISTDHLLQSHSSRLFFRNRFYNEVTPGIANTINKNEKILQVAQVLQIESILTMLMEIMEGNLLLMTGFFCISSVSSIYLLVIGILSSGNAVLMLLYAAFTFYVGMTLFLISCKCDQYNTTVSYAYIKFEF